MKRLIKIGVDIGLMSIVPVITWFLLGIILDNNLINVFTITYPIQFIVGIFKSVFSIGAEISKEKDHNNNAPMCGIVIGSILSIIIFGLLALNVDSYLTFMNMDVNTYRDFTIYSIIQINIQLIFAFYLDKLYFEDQHDKANIYSIIFSLINFITLIGSAILIKDRMIVIMISLISLLLFLLYIVIKNSYKFKFKFKIENFIKYDSTSLFHYIIFFLIYLFGFRNTMQFGDEYIIALTFAALITDTQWDILEAISLLVKIDVSKGLFNYKEHFKNAYKLLMILFLTIALLGIGLYQFYDLKMEILLIYMIFEFVNFILYPVYTIQTAYIQLEHSALKATTNRIVSNVIRMILSMLKNPFCTGIGQAVSAVYQFLTVNIMFIRNYELDELGNVIKRSNKNG